MNVFVARQPIFNGHKKVVAYELLFRTGIENFYDESQDGDTSTSRVIANSMLVIGMDTLTKGKPAFINFTRNLLLRGAPANIPSSMLTVEVLESVEPDGQVVEACRSLKDKGYTIALDDFVFEAKYLPLVDLADIIKVDFRITTGVERRYVVEECRNTSVQFLAEKVETFDEFREALEAGYTYFQGYFFSEPDIVKGRDIPNNKLNYLKVVNEVNRPEIDFESLESSIKHDIALTYKLLRFINSAYFNFSVKVESIRHALVMLGVKEIKRWVNIVALSGMGYDKPEELLFVALIRARFCEHLAARVGMKSRDADFFLMGLFSVIDGIIDQPMERILADLPLLEDIKQALLGGQNTLHSVFSLVQAYETGDWELASSIARELNIKEEGLPQCFFDAVNWAHNAL